MATLKARIIARDKPCRCDCKGWARFPWGDENVIEVGIGKHGSEHRTKWWKTDR